MRVGVVGCGLISSAHLKAWARADGFRAAAVFDLDRPLAEKRAKEFGVPAVSDSLEALLAECDVVDVCTPPQTHARIAEQAVRAGRHLVMEKPVVTDVRDWDRIIELLADSPSKLVVIHNLKFLPSVQRAKQWVDEGRIGRVLRVQREFMTSPSSDRMLVGEQHWSHSLPGGRWFETLPHELYLTHYFAGPLELGDVTLAHTDRAPSGAPADEVLISLKSAGCLATIHFSAHCEQNRRVFTLHGTEGSITVDLLSDFASLSTVRDAKWNRALGRGLIDAGRTLLRGATDRPRYAVQHLRGDSPHSRIILGLARHLRGEGPHPTPIEEVDYVVRNCELIGREIDRKRVGPAAA
ncbi:MAG TPA: Gfo/Idh/MocA family oxidoreductase [Kofleriaceae bacterium]|nr:Gfo/Idh/MocA family oxidoreductase [Kofleriaceae bacterium]